MFHVRSSSLPPPVAAFIAQVADTPGSDVMTLDYAASILLPLTGWPQETFVERFLQVLATPPNSTTLATELEQQRNTIFSPFSLQLDASPGINSAVIVIPRPSRLPDGTTHIVASLLPPLPTKLLQHDTGMERSRLLTLLDILPAYVVLIDENHIIRFDNRIFRKFFERGNGKPCYQVLRDRSSPCPNCPPFTVFSSNAICVHEWVSSKTDNAFRVHSYPFADMAGNKLVLKVGINITAGVKAQSALDLSEQRYRNLTDNLTLGVALLDMNLNIVTLNPRLHQWLGGSNIAKDTPMATQLENLGNPQKQKQIMAALYQAIDTKHDHEFEFSLHTESGEQQHFRIVASPILNRQQKARAVTMILEDITERQALASRMQQLQKLEAMATLTAGIAHEINQPLSALHLYASGMQMLLEQEEAIPVRRILDRLSLILQQADTIREIITHMRTLVTHEESSPPGPCSLPEAVSATLTLVGAQLSAHDIHMRVSIPEDLPLVMASRIQLEQVLINLLVNAMHALDTVLRPRKEIHITAEKHTDGGVRIKIIDNGPGLKGNGEKIFNPFFTTKEAHQGMGLGLSIVHAFVTGWGGEIHAGNSTGDSGAVFTIRLRTTVEGESPCA